MILRILALIAATLLAAFPSADAPELLKLTGDVSGVDP